MAFFCLYHFRFIPAEGMKRYLPPGEWFWFKEQWFQRESRQSDPRERTALIDVSV